MKITTRLLVITLVFFMAPATSAHAQTPRAQLQQMVEQLQKSPNDNALREKIIRLATSIKPAPAIPEEANRTFVKGNVFQKEAKDASGYELAIASYRDALRAAPWWGDAYFNLSVALDSAGKFDEAIASVRNYMASVSAGSAEARDAQNKIYALEAKSEMATKQGAITAQAQETAEKERLRPSMEGTWSWGNTSFRLVRIGERFEILLEDYLVREGGRITDAAVDQNRQHIRYTQSFRGCSECTAVFDLSLSSSGREMIGTIWDQSGGTRPAGPFTK